MCSYLYVLSLYFLLYFFLQRNPPASSFGEICFICCIYEQGREESWGLYNLKCKLLLHLPLFLAPHLYFHPFLCLVCRNPECPRLISLEYKPLFSWEWRKEEGEEIIPIRRSTEVTRRYEE